MFAKKNCYLFCITVTRVAYSQAPMLCPFVFPFAHFSIRCCNQRRNEFFLPGKLAFPNIKCAGTAKLARKDVGKKKECRGNYRTLTCRRKMLPTCRQHSQLSRRGSCKGVRLDQIRLDLDCYLQRIRASIAPTIICVCHSGTCTFSRDLWQLDPILR